MLSNVIQRGISRYTTTIININSEHIRRCYINRFLLSCKIIKYWVTSILRCTKEYCLGKTGGRCSEDGKDAVTTEDECIKSVFNLRKQYPSVEYSMSVSMSTRPQGCYMVVNSQKLYFNNLANSGSLSNFRDRAQVCTSCLSGAYFFKNTF